MALSGLDIYKLLPKTNCGECGIPTCLAFAMKLAAGQAELEACPYVGEDVKQQLSEASAPPIRVVTIGKGDKALSIGGETVLFRHDKTFVNAPGFAVLVEDSAGDDEIAGKVKAANEVVFERVAQELRSDLVAIQSKGDAPRFAQVAKSVSEQTELPLILMSEDPEVMKAALASVGESRPLIYAATRENYEAMAGLAKEHDCPLAVRGDNGLESLADLSSRLADAGLKDLVLDPVFDGSATTLKNLVFIRRAALEKKLRPLGYPVMTVPARETDDSMMEAMLATTYVAKYAGIIVLRELEPWKMLPLYVLRQNIYTDPQRPMQVEKGIYEIGTPNGDSPVLLTTNFSLTYFIVSSEIESSKVGTYLAVADAEGLSVLTAWAAGKFVPERIAPFIKQSGIADKVKHRNLVIPGAIAQTSGELEEELGDWKVMVGPREATDIPAFLKGWSPSR